MNAPDSASRPELKPLWFSDLRSAATSIPWLWHGYLAAGNVTLLTSQWKSGKTTLVSLLLARLKNGGLFAGLPVEQAKAVVVSEESPAHWQLRGRKLDFGDHVCWFCRPFLGKPSTGDWLDLIDRLAALNSSHGVGLAVIDPLASFLPRAENDAALVLEALLPLQKLTALGMAVLILHHPKKGETLAGQAARGSGALSGYVDVIIEMQCYSPNDDADRRRRLRAFSRYDETLRQLVIELDPEGVDYLAHGDFDDEIFQRNWQTLHSVLDQALGKRDRRQILEAWPPDFTAPEQGTLWRWLDRALAKGLVCRQGTGRKNDPYRYWLTGQEEKWRKNPFAEVELNLPIPNFDFPPRNQS